MYRRKNNIIFSEKLEKHLNNGFSVALISSLDTLITVKRYLWELELQKKVHKVSKIVHIRDMLREV